MAATSMMSIGAAACRSPFRGCLGRRRFGLQRRLPTTMTTLLFLTSIPDATWIARIRFLRGLVPYSLVAFSSCRVSFLPEFSLLSASLRLAVRSC